MNQRNSSMQAEDIPNEVFKGYFGVYSAGREEE